ncbi:general odorant-binding protein 19d-like [Aethina tumida]|uniref:general odorant-binding protein 19d-like n=1 Tax=Aethina tumida TaxID=116153 RepID=UPI002148A685|nr:general odorant-binding protein 19d-like [Aethina tumida]
MKKFFILACFIVAANALSKEFIEKCMAKMHAIGAKCAAETGASNDDIAELIAHKIPGSHEGKCTIYCFHKAWGMQNEDGSPNLEKAIQSMDALKAEDADVYGKVKTAFETCLPSVAIDADPCITGANMAVCIKSEGEKMGLTREAFEI